MKSREFLQLSKAQTSYLEQISQILNSKLFTLQDLGYQGSNIVFL